MVSKLSKLLNDLKMSNLRDIRIFEIHNQGTVCAVAYTTESGEENHFIAEDIDWDSATDDLTNFVKNAGKTQFDWIPISKSKFESLKCVLHEISSVSEYGIVVKEANSYAGTDFLREFLISVARTAAEEYREKCQSSEKTVC